MDEIVRDILASSGSAHEVLTTLMPALGKALQCQRCVLFLRNPLTTQSSMTHRWWVLPEFALERDRNWQPEPETLPLDDPMFAEALRNPEALFIEDITNADPALVNAAYELEHFRHTALIHAPVYHDGQMFGILEPCVFDGPRKWSDDDRKLTAAVQQAIGPLAARYVRGSCPLLDAS